MLWTYLQRTMRKILSGLVIVTCLGAYSVCAAASPEGEMLSEMLAKEIGGLGAQAVVSRLYVDNEKEWRYITAQIATGDTRWLYVASLLAPGTDAASSATLNTAIALAIPHNPVGVLNILTSRVLSLNVEQVCSLPFYVMPEPEFNQYVLDAIRALYKVPAGKECMDIMINIVGQSYGFNGKH